MFGDLNQRLVNSVIIKFVVLSSPTASDCLSLKQTSFESKATAGSFSKTVLSDPERTAHSSEQRKDVIPCEARLGARHHGVRIY